MSKKAIILLASVLVAIAAGIACLLLFRGPAEAPAPEPVDPVVKRMSDPSYVARLDAQRDERREIMKRMSAVKQELERAQAEGASEEAIAALKEKIRQGVEDLEKNRLTSQVIVRNRMLQDMEDANQLQKKGK